MTERLELGINSVITYFVNSQFVFTLIVGVAFTVFFIALFSIFNSVMNPVRRQMRALSLTGDTAERTKKSDWMEACLMPFRRVLIPQSESEIAVVKHRLALAGMQRESDLVFFFFSKILLALIVALLALLGTTFIPDISPVEVVFFVCLGAGIGMVMPNFILAKKTEARKLRIVHAFPDMLDLLVACTEAGLGLNAAIQRVAKEIRMNHPDLAFEMRIINAEMLAGVDRVDALKAFSDRTEIDDISGFVSMLVQSVRFGTGIAETLRIYAEEFRDIRMQRAEEAAEKVGTKLLFPLVICIFPSFFVVAVGPAAISIIKAFGGS